MKPPIRSTASFRTMVALALSAGILAGCASTPATPPGAAVARDNLATLQNDPNLANMARQEIREAETAVQLAEQGSPRSDTKLSEHRVYMAERKVEIARAKATTRHAESQRQALRDAQAEARLTARTAEADRSRRSAADLQRELDLLQAEKTERGIVLILGDLLFATGSAELADTADANLNRLAELLYQYPDRDVLIEGHTDNTGDAAMSQRLSERRAASVRSYLLQRGLSPERLKTAGLGQDRPVATNDSALGRQQNRRVEVIIDNPPTL